MNDCQPGGVRSVARALLICFAALWLCGPGRAEPVMWPAAPAVNDSPPTVSLTFEQVLSIAFDRNPTFAEFAANLERARAEILIASAYPNPEIELAVGRARTRESPTERGTEYEASLMQPIELPGKRRARRTAARAGLAVADREREDFQTALRAEAATAYYTVRHHIRAVALATETAAIAAELEAIVRRRVEGGETPELDLIRARLERLKAQRLIQDRRRRLAGARIALNVLCGDALPSDFALADSLPVRPEPVAAEPARARALAGHPELLRLDAQVARQRAVIERERTAWHPDLKPAVSAGRELDTAGYSVSLGVAIPLWNRNQGGIAAARADLQRLEAERERRRLTVDGEVRRALEADANARERLAAFDESLRQGAAEALRIETVLYEQGEHDLLQLLDARRTAQETEAEFLQARYDAAMARIELERAMGIKGDTP